VIATVHPAAVLRAPDSREREKQRQEFVRDLKKITALINKKAA
jgi:uracil-DNA glycosylase